MSFIPPADLIGLPTEMLYYIFDFLSLPDAINWIKTCSTLYFVCDEESFYRKRCLFLLPVMFNLGVNPIFDPECDLLTWQERFRMIQHHPLRLCNASESDDAGNNLFDDRDTYIKLMKSNYKRALENAALTHSDVKLNDLDHLSFQEHQVTVTKQVAKRIPPKPGHKRGNSDTCISATTPIPISSSLNSMYEDPPAPAPKIFSASPPPAPRGTSDSIQEEINPDPFDREEKWSPFRQNYVRTHTYEYVEAKEKRLSSIDSTGRYCTKRLNFVTSCCAHSFTPFLTSNIPLLRKIKGLSAALDREYLLDSFIDHRRLIRKKTREQKQQQKSTSNSKDKDKAEEGQTEEIGKGLLYKGVEYFEAKVIKNTVTWNKAVAIAVSQWFQGDMSSSFVGWQDTSAAWHSDDGTIRCDDGFFGHDEQEKLFGLFGEGDVVGCGVYWDYMMVFFTMNGEKVKTAKLSKTALLLDKKIPLYPTVGIQVEGDVMKVNFGTEPFLFDVKEWKKRVDAEPPEVPEEKWEDDDVKPKPKFFF
eukprot:TRINITY_DN11048_c0_g1_i1.p1 TRINITY_DN11048_c0_g1~~TRINITY_DN11048_c0_g1_i1.p1  ORF type:complete len:543 (-),score=145.20 TRINITY_DN11048_c0_g1_i1:80-1666(-)